MQWYCKAFDQLSLQEFHNILKLRIDIFVVEQNCPYPELDDKDQKALHVFTFSENNSNEIIAYSRIFRPGDYYDVASFGRVAVHSSYRGKNLGNELMQKTIDFIEQKFNTNTIKISAQTYLKKFYKSFKFKQAGKEYLEDGIPHIPMLRSN